jgi:predicted RNA polymerase sigma factor
MLTAKHHAIDCICRNERLASKLRLLGHELETGEDEGQADLATSLDEEKIDDDLLRLMFISCRLVLSIEARIALTLRLLGGLTTEEIARGFLAAEPTIAKRIVRARRTLSGRAGWRPCSRCSTWCSTRAIRRWPGTTGCAPHYVMRRCDWAACWLS